jgi:hypothetical protein
MPLTIGGHELSTTSIFEDQPDAREAYAENLEEIGLETRPQTGPVGKIRDCLKLVQHPGHAVLSDHFLNHRNYAQFEGAQFVKLLYKNYVPAVLCTRYQELIDDIRPYRRWIPALTLPDELDGDRFLAGIEQCLREFADQFEANRKPWRTQIKVAEIWEEEKQFFVEIPAWSSTLIPLKFKGVPTQILEDIAEGWRTRAIVNLGAESLADLYISDWEILG